MTEPDPPPNEPSVETPPPVPNEDDATLTPAAAGVAEGLAPDTAGVVAASEPFSPDGSTPAAAAAPTGPTTPPGPTGSPADLPPPPSAAPTQPIDPGPSPLPGSPQATFPDSDDPRPDAGGSSSFGASEGIPAASGFAGSAQPTTVSDPPDPPYDAAPAQGDPVGADGAGSDASESTAEAEDGSQTCPACGETMGAEAKWCEACGGDLTGGGAPPIPAVDAPVAPPCVSCAADGSEITDDGYCSQCGYKQPAERDHTETDLGNVAGVSDRGKRHRHNEDSYALSTHEAFRVLVVCDGVSTTSHSEQASQLAADTACEFLVAEVADNLGASVEALEALQAEAILAAQAAVAALPPSPEGEASPSCTIVTSVLLLAPEAAEGRLVLGWLGDSRGYWVDESGAQLLTFDHSWAAEQVREGLMDETEAMADPRAHSITRWIGADALEVYPETTSREVTAGGKLLLCSDGLWNYRATEPEMTEALATHSEFAETPVALARSLTAMANELGGHDNITVLIAQT